MYPQNTAGGRCLAFGIDRLETPIRGVWDRSRLAELVVKLPVDQPMQWHGEPITLKRGNSRRDHGPLPEWRVLRVVEGQDFQIELFDQNPSCSCRLLLFASAFRERDWEATARSRLQRFGLDWQGESVTRLDLRCDVPLAFQEFAKRIPANVVSRANHNKLNNCPSTIYYGNNDRVRLRIYDKVEELRSKGIACEASPLTRIEFELHRKWLTSQACEALAGIDCSSLWKQLANNFFRVTAYPRGPSNPKRDKPWNVWEEIANMGASKEAWNNVKS